MENRCAALTHTSLYRPLNKLRMTVYVLNGHSEKKPWGGGEGGGIKL